MPPKKTVTKSKTLQALEAMAAEKEARKSLGESGSEGGSASKVIISKSGEKKKVGTVATTARMSTGGTSARAKGVKTPSSSKLGKVVQTPDVSKLNLQSPIKIPALPKASIEISGEEQAKVLTEALYSQEGTSEVRKQPKRGTKLTKIDYAENVDDEEGSSFSDESETDGGESPKITYDSAMATLQEAGTSKLSEKSPKKQVTPVKKNVVKKRDRVPDWYTFIDYWNAKDAVNAQKIEIEWTPNTWDPKCDICGTAQGENDYCFCQICLTRHELKNDGSNCQWFCDCHVTVDDRKGEWHVYGNGDCPVTMELRIKDREYVKAWTIGKEREFIDCPLCEENHEMGCHKVKKPSYMAYFNHTDITMRLMESSADAVVQMPIGQSKVESATVINAIMSMHRKKVAYYRFVNIVRQLTGKRILVHIGVTMTRLGII